MVTDQIDRSTHVGYIVLTPNLSGTYKTVLLIVILASFYTIGIAVVFAILGMWLVLPFAGLEVGALVWAVLYIRCKNSVQEVIWFNQYTVRVEKGRFHADKEWSCHRQWARIEVRAGESKWYPERIFLHYGNKNIEIGRFLNVDDKELLIDVLRKLIPVHC